MNIYKLFRKIAPFFSRHRKNVAWLEKINSQYQIWLKKNGLPDITIEKKHREVTSFKFKPKITLILIASRPRSLLEKTIASVLEQIYPEFELLIINCFENAQDNQTINSFMEKDKRIKLSQSETINEVIEQASGYHVGMVWPGDQLHINTLFEIVKLINQENKAPDIIYTDEDKIDSRGKYIEPFFKPDWSPDLLLSIMYVGQLVLFRRELLNKVTIPKNLYSRNLLWDLCLKMSEMTNRIYHIPDILFTQSLLGKSISGWPELSNKEYSIQPKILKNTLKRRNINGKVEEGFFKGSYRIKYGLIDKPLVSIIISTKDKVDLLSKCINGIFSNNSYKNFELIIIDNQSVESETFKYFEKLKNNPKIRLLKYDEPFNIAAIFNWAVRFARGEFILFMGNDTEPVTKDWLERMVSYGQRDHIGAVGAKLLYPDKSIQHAGVVLGYGSASDNSDRVAGHCFSHFPDSFGYFGFINLARNYSAVTGACLLTKKSLYLKVGGFNEEILKVRFNDVDYCLKLGAKGYYIVYAPECVLYHYESTSVSKIRMDPQEIKYMRKKWSFWEDNDPFYNPNLTLDSTDYTLRI